MRGEFQRCLDSHNNMMSFIINCRKVVITIDFQ